MNSNLCWLLVRLAILLGVFLVQSSDGATYQKFLRSHIDPAGPGNANLDAYCNQMMVRRGMRCKKINTFILASANSVLHVCRGGGTHVRKNLYDSNQNFNVVVCRRIRLTRRGCWFRGQRQNKKIRVGCVRSQPVHLEP